MVRIVADTSTLYSTKQAREAGFAVSPLAVTIAGETYRELDEITPERFVEIIAKGNMPASSQPAIGEVMDRDHTTVLASITNVTTNIRTVKGEEERIDALIKKIKG